MVTLSAISMFMPMNAVAQVTKDTLQVDTAKRFHLEQVDVSGKSANRKIKEQAFSVNVIDAKQLYNSSVDLNQVLNRSTGVRVREDGGLGSNFNFSLNGFTGRQVKFFIDGLPMDNFGSSLTLNNFPATMAERVKVYKGVLPISLGGDALGGAVNIVTRSNANYFDVSYGFGSFNTHKASVNGAYTNAKTGFTVRTNAFYNYSDNNYKVRVEPIDWSAGNGSSGTRLPLQEVERFHDSYQSIAAQVDLGVTNKSYADHLLIGAILAGNNKDIQTGVTMDRVFGARTSNSNSLIPTLKYKKTDLFIEGLDLSAYSAYNITNNHFVDTTSLQFNWLQETVPTNTGSEFMRSQLHNRDKEALVSANLSYALNNNQGISLNYVLTDFRRKSSDVEDPNNPTFALPQRLQKQTLGLAWQATYNRFTATAFAKLYDMHAESFENVSTNTIPEYTTTSLDRTHTGYGAAAAYFILSNLQAKTSFEQAYRLPEATEILGDGLFIGRNANLRPENSKNFNLGALYNIALNQVHQFSLEGNFILRNAKDYIRQDQLQTAPIDRPNINVGNVRTTGGDAEIRYSWKNMLFAGVNATYQRIIDRTEFLTSENLTGTITTPNLNYGYRIPNMPYLFGNVNVGGRFHPTGNKENALSLNYNLSYVEKYYLTPNHLGANNQDVIPRQVAHDIFADYALQGGKYIIALECRNIADSQLFDNFRLQKPGRSFFVKLRYFITQ